MSDLSDAQRAELQQELLAVQAQLQQLLAASAEGARPVALDQPIGRLSRMDALQQQAMTKANRQDGQRRLALVEAALLALRHDRYGDCRRCEEPIPYARLKVRPETPFCRACQAEMEGRG